MRTDFPILNSVAPFHPAIFLLRLYRINWKSFSDGCFWVRRNPKYRPRSLVPLIPKMSETTFCEFSGVALKKKLYTSHHS